LSSVFRQFRDFSWICGRVMSYCACRSNFPLRHAALVGIRAYVCCISWYQSSSSFPTMACRGAHGGGHATIGNVYELDETTCDEQLTKRLL
jgi:hypothetical protein